MKVTGSDENHNQSIQNLEKIGVKFFNKHSASNIKDDCTSVVYTEAIDKSSNPEYLEALRRKIPTKSYFEALGELSKEKKSIVVTGTHGKTTTTAMLGQALIESGKETTVIVGSRVPFFNNRNVYIGKDEYFVVEGCEYRENFLSLEPFGVVLLNCELEHVDYYKSEEDYRSAFIKLIKKIPKNGFLVFNQEDENCQVISQFYEGRKIGVSMHEAKKIDLNIPGEFNKLNAAHALEAGRIIGTNEELLLKGLKEFRGTSRRMENKGLKEKVMVIDDYAHHPTEIEATLEALKKTYPNRRLICVFQPHQYSRTLELLDGFKTSFLNADIVIIPNIYEARDSAEDKAKISAKKLASQILNAMWIDGPESTVEWLNLNTKESDLVVTMGAGDVYQIGDAFLN